MSVSRCRKADGYTLFRILINEINANHEAQSPQGLARNVILIRELNNNITKVILATLLELPI